jgi:taurine dioxygenase
MEHDADSTSDSAGRPCGPDDGGRFGVVPLGPTLGAELRHADLAEAARDAQVFGELAALVWRYKVLLVPDQTLDSEEFLALAQRFGPVEDLPNPRAAADRPSLIRLGEGPYGMAPCDRGSHVEASWREVPPMVCLLRCVEAPPDGCDMAWTDMAEAYRRLPADLRARVAGLRGLHSIDALLPDTVDPGYLEVLRKRYPAVEHPVVRTHPETGERLLFVDAFTTGLVGPGTEDEQADDLLALLQRQAAAPGTGVSWRVTGNCVAIWDNRSTQHHATPGEDCAVSRFERIRVVGGDVR